MHTLSHNESQVVLHFARELLRQRPTWERPEFMAAWQDALPEVKTKAVCAPLIYSGWHCAAADSRAVQPLHTVRERLPLQGCQAPRGALRTASSQYRSRDEPTLALQGFQADQGALRGVALPEAEDRLRYFPADALPAAPAARFAMLFEARPRWAADDISPFLDGMQVGPRRGDCVESAGPRSS